MPFHDFAATALTVLVVDDIASTRRVLSSLVQKMGHRVILAEDGETALLAYEQAKPDMVLLDLLMPGIDGFEVTRRIKNLAGNKWVPVVVLSGLEGEQHLLAALEAGADDFLQKPAEPAILASKFKNLARVLVLQQQHAVLLSKSMAVSENSFDGILIVDSDEMIQGLNLAAERLLKTERDMMLGLQVKAFLPGLDFGKAKHGAHHGQLQQLEMQPLIGDAIAVELGLTLVEQGNEQFWLLILRDVSERQRVDRLKQQFIATLSHELRTPLTSIIGSLKMLQSSQFAAVDERAFPLLEIADRNASRLLHMVNELLDLNKAAAGALQLELGVYPLLTLLAEFVEENQGYAAKYDVDLQLYVEIDATCEIRTDKMRFGQIMSNLISNACKYSPARSEVKVIASTADSVWQIIVQDRGPGIAGSFLPHLFDPFTQADASDSRLYGGTGLGLAISRQLCSALGGTISYQAAQGGGSEFIVLLPLKGA
ncbi:hybrid sensor histidine kinase/response regulator [Deefgea piscis]|uniref:histidine kinase n=1 Tax=Deefgea piscis TaxID=2739061 RepID=A0A6M8SUC0_9NEIS|nr:hybrid sensor histidine kinase/response regulator [Deefgea piscis]QKJ67714.1 hybrid sensor histidine kinase/response regulator [Deefgea piscis]